MKNQYENIKNMSYAWDYGLHFMMVNNIEADLEGYIFKELTQRRPDIIGVFVEEFFIAKEKSL